MPILLALLCILSVFVPAFIMEDPLRSLFMPLTLAVGFAMISSYLLSQHVRAGLVRLPAQTPRKHGGKKSADLFDRLLDGLRQAGRVMLVGIALGRRARLSGRLRPDPLAALACSSAPNCFRRSIRASSCCGSGLRRARITS